MADTEREEITDERIAHEASKAALSTTGVHALLPGFTETIQGNILRRNVEAPGVRVSRDGDRADIDLTLMTDYGCNIPSVAWNVQERVKKRVEQRTGITVNLVNIHVQKIYFGTPEENEDEKQG